MRPFRGVKMLNADEYRVLKEALARRKTPAGRARRARVILLSNQGFTAREIAQRLECNERTALKWINRFNKHGVAGLEEGPREGRPRVYGPEDVGAVIQAALTPPQELSGCRSLRGLWTGWSPTSRRRGGSAWDAPGSRRCSRRKG